MKNPRFFRHFLLLILTSAILSASGCSILVGNVKPTTEPAENYRAMDLSKRDPDWAVLPTQRSDDRVSGEVTHSDLAFQAKSTGSIMSVNSACGKGPETQSEDLEYYTHLLLLGISDIQGREKRQIHVSGVPALQTTFEGIANRRKTKMSAVVVKNGHCVYDLLYISKPENFSLHEGLFQEFVTSFQVY